jgi:DNA modification methylase
MKTYHDGRVTVHGGDCLAVLAELPAESFDAVVTDPPYFLTSIVKRFGKDGSAPAQFGSDGRFSRLSGGFMNKRWDAPPVPVIDPAFAHWMAGFIDGEGCFSVHKKQVNGCETFDCQFTLTLRADDRPILEQMRIALGGIGSIAHRPARNKGGKDRDQSRYCISAKRDCQRLRAVLSAFPLRAKKARDFEIWAQALDAWLDHEPGSSWEDVAYFRDALMAVRNFGSTYRPERLFFYQVGRSILRVLKPGAHFIAFGGSRTYHNMTVGFEDAGFEVRDCIAFLYGSGFPKSHNLNGDWEGWGTALKPAIEFIFLGRKPLSERTIAANVMQHGTGALNIDACRVGTGETIKATRNISLGHSASGIYGGANVPGVYEQKEGGRWPANVCHDGSDEVVSGFPVQSSGNPNKIDGGNGGIWKDGTGRPAGDVYGDSGSAARFFYSVKPDHRCHLCNVNFAEPTSRIESIPTVNSVRSDAPDLQPRGSEDSENLLSDRANSAASGSAQCHPQSPDSAQNHVPILPLESIVQNALCAAALCRSCATDIAHALVEVKRNGRTGRSPIKCSIAEYKRTILSRSLAKYVAHRESTDIILTTESLKELFGSVFHAIDNYISEENRERLGRSGQSRFWYSSKADADDRLGSKHPTVKPLDLMQWLVRLITPPGGHVLDCFAGTGTTAEAALREGFRCTLIEREAEYLADIDRRMAHVFDGEVGRGVAIAKTKPDSTAPAPLLDFIKAAAE